MKEKEEIIFLKQFREKVVKYLFQGCAPAEIVTYNETNGLDKMKLDLERQRKMREALKKPEFQVKKQEINKTKKQAQQILTKCNVRCVLTQYPLKSVGGPILRFNLLDLITENKTRSTISLKTFTDKIDEAIETLEEKLITPPPEAVSTAAQDATSYQKEYIFLLMPANIRGPAKEAVCANIIRAAEAVKMLVKQADGLAETEQVTERSIKLIEKARIIVIDLSGGRPQAYYQAGYAHALGKKPIYIAKKGTPLKLDTATLPVLFYQTPEELSPKLKRKFAALLR